VRVTEPTDDLERAFRDALAAEDSEPLLRYIATVAGSAHHEHVYRWWGLFSELRQSIQQQIADFDTQNLYLRLVADAQDLLVKAERRAREEEERNRVRLGALGRGLQEAASENQIWTTVRREVLPLLGTVFLLQDVTPGSADAKLRFGWHAGNRVELAPGAFSMALLPAESLMYPVSFGFGTSGFAVLDLESHCDWLSHEVLFEQLAAALGRVAEQDRLRGVEWGDAQHVELSRVARRIKAWLKADIVIIYPLLNETFPVVGRGPVVAGRLHAPDLMLQTVGAEDVVTKLMQHGETVLIDDTETDHRFAEWFHRSERPSFQAREGVRALSGHVLRWGPKDDAVGVMFCNYRRPTPVTATARFSERLAAPVALEVRQAIDEIVAQLERPSLGSE
jgi:hypothetical protein